ncbi:MAG TPA: DUF4267 domain-containing protein [Chloroflexota bacterium]|nr:DUF4267 domain-containing protein [Chloroflexota bacterium]
MRRFENDRILRHLATALGAGTTVFGIWPALAPRGFARTFGLPTDGGPGALAAIRSVGVRDTVTGMGLCSAAMHGGKYAPWLLSRLLVDAGDVLVMALACRQQRSNREMAVLGLLALGAAGVDALLWRAAKRAGRREGASPASPGR